MAEKLGEAYVVINARLKPLKAGLAKARKLVKSFVSSQVSLIKKAFATIIDIVKKAVSIIWKTAKWGALGFVAMSVAAVKFAMDAEETENLFTVAMGKMGASARKWSDQMAKALHLNRTDLKKYISSLHLMLVSMGLNEKAAFKMAKGMVELAHDIASLRNLRLEEAFEKIRSGITGEMEPLKRLGILVGDEFVKEMALTKGLSKKGQTLTQLQKIYLRYQAMVEQTTADQGDMLRTVNDLTNVLRQVRQQVKTLAEAFGKGLLPVVTEVSIKLREFLENGGARAENFGQAVGKGLNKAIDMFKKLLSTVKEWAEKTAASFVFVKDIMVAIADWFKSDWIAAIKTSLTATLPIWQAFGEGIVKIFKKVATDIENALVTAPAKAFAKFRFIKSRESSLLAAITAKEGAQGSLGMFPSGEQRQRARATATREAAGIDFGKQFPSIETQSIKSLMAEIAADIKAAASKSFDKLPSVTKDAIAKAYDKLRKTLGKITEKYESKRNRLGEEFWGKLGFPTAKKGGLEPLPFPDAGAPKGGGGKVGFVGLKEAWKQIAGSAKSPMVMAQKKANEFLKNIDQNTKNLSGVGTFVE